MECTPCFYNQHHGCYHRWVGLGGWVNCECTTCKPPPAMIHESTEFIVKRVDPIKFTVAPEVASAYQTKDPLHPLIEVHGMCTVCSRGEHEGCYGGIEGLSEWVPCECPKCHPVPCTDAPWICPQSFVDEFNALTPLETDTAFTSEEKKQVAEGSDRAMLTAFKTIIREWPEGQQQALYEWLHDACDRKYYK